MDKFVESVLMPEYTRGALRRRTPEYRQCEGQKGRAKKRNDRKAYRTYDKRQRSVPALDPYDPDYRRLRSIRYADDLLLAFAGPQGEAEEIKHQLTSFLEHELKLELSQPKTRMAQGRTERARFLGYALQVQHCDSWRDARGQRNVNGEIALSVPPQVRRSLCARYQRAGKPRPRSELILNSDFDIIARYQAAYRGYVQYYALAQNLHELTTLPWVMKTSLLKPLANKYRSTVRKMAKRYTATLATPPQPHERTASSGATGREILAGGGVWGYSAQNSETGHPDHGWGPHAGKQPQ